MAFLAKAHELVSAVAAEADEKEKAKYKTAVKGAPAFIQSCGLAQAVSYFEAKKASEPQYGRLLSHLETMTGAEDLSHLVRKGELEEYMFLTRRAQRALVFLKRMVDGLMPKVADEA